MRISISAGVVFLAGLLSPLSPGNVGHQPTEDLAKLRCTFNMDDPRPERLRKFFRNYDSPAEDLAEEFVESADKYHLDYRLLPAIAIVESGGGKTSSNHNLFGWGNGKLRFKSREHGIETVARTMATWEPYRNKTLDQALKVYNYEIGTYGELVKSLMRAVDGRPLHRDLVLAN